MVLYKDPYPWDKQGVKWTPNNYHTTMTNPER